MVYSMMRDKEGPLNTTVTYSLTDDSREFVISIQTDEKGPLYLQQIVDGFFEALDAMQLDGSLTDLPDSHKKPKLGRAEELN